ENLEMGGYVDPKGSRRRIDEIFARFPVLADKRRHAARTLSGGQRQMLAMAMALMVAPALLLLDEPSAGLAPRAAEQLFDTGAASLAVAGVPAVARGQGGVIRLGTLTPLTGNGGNYGPSMLKAMQWVAGEINAAGGVRGRKIQLVSEDDQTNPEAGVRAARKLIDLDKVAAIMGTWASAVTTAVAPLCWESRTFLTTVSGSDTITLLPHQGYLVRTQPNTQLQGRKFAEFMVAQGSKRVGILAVQAPFAL